MLRTGCLLLKRPEMTSLVNLPATGWSDCGGVHSEGGGRDKGSFLVRLNSLLRYTVDAPLANAVARESTSINLRTHKLRRDSKFGCHLSHASHDSPLFGAWLPRSRGTSHPASWGANSSALASRLAIVADGSQPFSTSLTVLVEQPARCASPSWESPAFCLAFFSRAAEILGSLALLLMGDESAAREGRARKSGDFLSRFPALSLERRDPHGPLLVPEIDAGHELYALAAWVYHHGDELEEGIRRALYIALERAWPREKGRPRTRRTLQIVVAILKEAGVPTKRIAEKLNRAPSDINALAREGKARRELGHANSSARLVPIVVPETEGRPYDPATLIGEQFARGRDATFDGLGPDLAQAEELAREAGFSSLEELVDRGYAAQG